MNKVKWLKVLRKAVQLTHMITWAIAFLALGTAIYIGEPWYAIFFAGFYMLRIGFTHDQCPFEFWRDKIDVKIIKEYES